MLRSIASWTFLLVGLVIGLGAFGHESNAAKVSAELAKYPALDAGVATIVLAVWHFCSGCMLAFGAICAWLWWRARRDGRAAFFASDVIGALYAITGLCTVWYTGRTFFWLFFVLGALLIVSSLPLRSASRNPAR
jgi:hypothetical protein